jgi:hypothetical protein
LSLAVPARLDELAGDVPGDFKRLRNRSTLRNKPGQLIGGRQVQTFRQLLDMDSNGELHPHHRGIGGVRTAAGQS